MDQMIKKAMTFALFGLLLTALPAAAGVEAYEALGIDKGKVISGTQASAQVLPGEEKQLVCLVAYFSGKGKNATVKLRLGVLQGNEKSYTIAWEQDFSSKYDDGKVGEGNLELLDLDRDGQAEIIVTFDLFSDPLIRQRFGEVIVWDEGQFKTAWSGPFEYDATKAVRDVPVERRDHFVRELDLINTLRTRGVTLFFNKTMIAVAGERLVEPKVVEETFPLRKRLNF
ncbi:MAG: hypothetical protein GTO30_13820 [Acidobacteria bacterium]|nr:hypothetical protein [Acidobacteriota bacterium]